MTWQIKAANWDEARDEFDFLGKHNGELLLIGPSSNIVDIVVTRSKMPGGLLENAAMDGCYLEKCLLDGFAFSYCDMSYATLKDCDANDSIFESVKMFKTDFENSGLKRCRFYGCNFGDRSYFDKCVLNGSLFDSCSFGEASFTDSQLAGCTFSGCDFLHTDLSLTNLTGASFPGCSFTNVVADYTKGADPAFLEQVKDSVQVVTDRRSYGKYTGAVVKASRPDAPRSPKDFKARFPFEAEVIKGISKGGPISKHVIEAAMSPVTWKVTRQKYSSDKQRLSPGPNDVLLFNIDLDDPSLNPRARNTLERISYTARRSGHPHEKGRLFTVGWIRFSVFPGVYLVEEVQSDVSVVRAGLRSGSASSEMVAAGVDPAQVEEDLGSLDAWASSFYADAMGVVFELAAMDGCEVEMLTYETKRQFGSPKSVYTDLPKQMGMKVRPASLALPGVGAVFHYRPNLSRRTRRR